MTTATHPTRRIKRDRRRITTSISTDVILELRRLCFEMSLEFPRKVCFAGQLVFTPTPRLFAFARKWKIPNTQPA